MTSDRFAPSGGGNEARNEFQAADEDARLPDPSVLEDVLYETIASNADAMEPEQLEALREVARRHRDAKFELDPIGVGLAEAILMTRYGALAVSDEECRAMSIQVAESLFEAENIRNRIESFWKLLCESVQ